MSERPTNTWPDGTPRSQGNAFDVPPKGKTSSPTVIPPKRGPRAVSTSAQRPPVLAGTRAFDAQGRALIDLAPRTVGAISITPSDPTRAGRMKASI